ncbi:hypothetical protein [Actibacterium pelagium]|nr:hypothetical protein [Actibacterium pelagium]
MREFLKAEARPARKLNKLGRGNREVIPVRTWTCFCRCSPKL